MTGANTNQLSRAMDSLTIGAVQDLRRLEAQRAAEGLQEAEEQFEIQVAGRAEEFAQWSFAEVRFGLVFVNGTGQRDSELLYPHFTYGAKIDTAVPVGLLASVMDWRVNDRGETTGAKLAIGVVGTDLATNFRAELHATFQGWAQPRIDFSL